MKEKPLFAKLFIKKQKIKEKDIKIVKNLLKKYTLNWFKKEYENKFTNEYLIIFRVTSQNGEEVNNNFKKIQDILWELYKRDLDESYFSFIDTESWANVKLLYKDRKKSDD